jgi:hypothetical protein
VWVVAAAVISYDTRLDSLFSIAIASTDELFLVFLRLIPSVDVV